MGGPADTDTYPEASKVDVVGFRVGIEGEELVAAFDTAGDIPIEPVGRSTVSFSLRVDHDGDGFGDTIAYAGNDSDWQAVVFGPASPLPLELEPAVVEGRTLTLRVPLAWLASAADVRVGGDVGTVAGYPEWAIGLEPLALGEQMRIRDVHDMQLEWWIDHVPGGADDFVSPEGADELAGGHQRAAGRGHDGDARGPAP